MNLAFFFKWQFPCSHILRIFQYSFIFREVSSHFFRITTEQLFLQGVCFCWGASFLEQSLICRVIFSEQLLFKSKTSTKQPQLENRKLLSGTATFSAEEMFRMKISTEELLFWSRCYCTALTFQKSYFLEKANFQKSNIPHYPLFLESYFFRATTFSKNFILYSSYLSEELLFHNILFQNSS